MSGDTATAKPEAGWAMPWPGAELATTAEAGGCRAFCAGEFADHNAYIALAEMAMATTSASVGTGIAYASSPRRRMASSTICSNSPR